MLCTELAVAPGAPLAGEGCRLLAQRPAQGKTACASGATTGATEWITRLSASSAFDSPKASAAAKGYAAGPLKEARWAVGRASVRTVARPTGQRTALSVHGVLQGQRAPWP